MIGKQRYRSVEKYLRENFRDAADGGSESAGYGAVGVALSSLRQAGPESFRSESALLKKESKARKSRSLEDIVSQPEESFSRMLFRLIRERGADEVATYKDARIDRKLFSKIRSNDDYRPGKATALSLALALKLNLDDTLDLLGKAGYTLSHSSKFDLIVEYYIQHSVHDIFEINEALDAFGQPALQL